ncbi:MAG: trigger factor [Oscillospiraceae bacterium]|nr:trigger factor [Oscillospiraceae bacterium]
MNLLKSEKKENNELELLVEVTPEELEKSVNAAYMKNRGRISVPGFRKGKAPRKIIERMYGAEIFLSDALDEILPEVLRFIMADKDLNTVGYPKISDVDVKDPSVGAKVTLIAALYPEVKIGEYKGLSAPKPETAVSDEEVDKEIESTRNRNARIESVERPAQDGDTTVINFEGFLDGVPFEGGKGENYDLVLGSGQFIPGFEDKIIGMTIGEERDIDLVFPENYKEDLAGKAVVFKVKVNEIKEKILPELDDEFVKDVSEFDTLKEYRKSIMENILKTRTKEVDETFEGLLMDKIAELIEADIPSGMIDEQQDQALDNLTRQISAYGMTPESYMQMLGITPDQFKERMRESSEKQVKVTLALNKIAELEKIEVSDADIDKEYEEASERFGVKVEEFKESVSRDALERDIKLKKAAQVVKDSAIVTKFEEDSEAPKKEEKKEKKPAAKKAPAKKAPAKKPAAKKKAEE